MRSLNTVSFLWRLTISRERFGILWARGGLGNQLFQIAAAISLAIDNDGYATFPKISSIKDWGIRENYREVFPLINEDKFLLPYEAFYQNEDFVYRPIPFKDRIRLHGYFQSEKYFKHNKDAIIKLFLPSEMIRRTLKEKYSDLLDHPNTVGIHARAYCVESKKLIKDFAFHKLDFYEKGADLFSEDALFLIFSDNITWAKELFKDFNRPHIFIEGNNQYEDFYLLSFCKHQILSSSTFGWWAAYLNPNPEKKVLAPDPWYNKCSFHSSKDSIPDEWIKMPY